MKSSPLLREQEVAGSNPVAPTDKAHGFNHLAPAYRWGFVFSGSPEAHRKQSVRTRREVVSRNGESYCSEGRPSGRPF